MTHPATPINHVLTMNVIQISFTKGDGTDGNPIRPVQQYWDPKGFFLAEYDSWSQKQDDDELRRQLESTPSPVPPSSSLPIGSFRRDSVNVLEIESGLIPQQETP